MSQFRSLSKEEYDSSHAWGILTSVDIHRCSPEKIRSREAILNFTKELCERIDVRRYGDTQVVMFGDDPVVHGFSMTQLIETSLVSAHFAEESDSVYLDVFSCKFYDAKELVEYAMKFFEGEYYNAHSILRGCAANLPNKYKNEIAERNIILSKNDKKNMIEEGTKVRF